MNDLKLSIQEMLENEDWIQAKPLIERYAQEHPADMDVIAMKTIYELYSGNLDTALQYALEGVRRYPTSADLHYNLGNVYESQGDWFWAWYEYGRAYTIYQYTSSNKAEELELVNLIQNCRQLYEAESGMPNHASCEEVLRNAFGLFETAYGNIEQQILGNYVWESVFEKRYAGIYWDYFTRNYEGNLDVIHTKGEFIKVTEGTVFEITEKGAEVLLPIAVEENNTLHTIICDEEEYHIRQSYNKHFTYYRLPAGAKVYSSGTAYYGKPIALCQEADKKKLVLNFFVDGLAQCILDGEEFKRIMPHTAQFFAKGTVCERAYSAAEWTYPSLVNLVTGLDTTHHMMFHNEIDGSIPADYPTLAEYFQEKGYYTTILNGDWRIIPIYGHARGYDSFIYQNAGQGFKVENAVGEVIDHLEAFKETNQFVWVSLGDMHNIADGFDLPHSVQGTLAVHNCVEEKLGVTSVKQGYSENKRIMFQKMASRMDLMLNVIYQYVESHYQDEDILISLFADHGQGYLVPPGEHFCSEGRQKVAFMFRGGKVKQQICSEVISTNDYIRIMCSLADIQMKEIEIDGVLPKAFGGNGREYAVAESIHPGDPYQAAVYAKDCVFYFSNPSPVQHDGRFYLEKYQTKLTDLQGSPISDDEKQEKYLAIILKHIAPLIIVE